MTAFDLMKQEDESETETSTADTLIPQLSEEQHSTSLGSSTPSRAAINPNTQHIFHPMISQRRRRKVKVFSSTDSLENDTAEGGRGWFKLT
ncbi:hypothetical protein NC653_004778 [Populus alba x Populus x berolinensis]|uniref:Uncharacterized protein n=1 Tax=Populus alba x Populus x berolinensis TaxID=444605 RepID=A0AAD6RY67_9ROSI|nr:hypothetical protein NC653_004778 [Populus alba x Populus x berolinensis]